MSKKNLLIIEDEEDQLIALSLFLESEFNVLTASTGERAIQLFQDHFMNIDLIIMDYQLPDMNAIDIYTQFEAICFSAIPPIIISTAYERPDDIIRIMTHIRAVGYLSKPFGLDELTQEIHNALHETYSYLRNESLKKDFILDQYISERNNKIAEDILKVRQAFGYAILPETMETNLIFDYDSSRKDLPFSVLRDVLEKDTGQLMKITFSNPKLLIVEDEDDLRDNIQIYFSDKSLDVITAKTVQEARTLLSQHSDIQVVLLDIHLPDGSGLEIIKDIKKGKNQHWLIQNEDFSVDVIVLTSFDHKEMIIDCIRHGANVYVTKPFSFDDLEAKVSQCLDRQLSLKLIPGLLNTLKQQPISFGIRKQVFLNWLKQKTGDDSVAISDIKRIFNITNEIPIQEPVAISAILKDPDRFISTLFPVVS